MRDRSLPRSGAVRYARHRQVFWLSDQSTDRAFSSHSRQWRVRRSSPITAAGPRWSCTTFPANSLPTRETCAVSIQLSISGRSLAANGKPMVVCRYAALLASKFFPDDDHAAPLLTQGIVLNELGASFCRAHAGPNRRSFGRYHGPSWRAFAISGDAIDSSRTARVRILWCAIELRFARQGHG